MKSFIIYLKKSLLALKQKPDWNTLSNAIRFYPSWKKYQSKGAVMRIHAIPWFSFGAIDFIEHHIKPEMNVFEYGSGGSTLFWSDRVKKIVSVEHEGEWYRKMSEDFKIAGINNVEYHYSPAEKDENYHLKSSSDSAGFISSDPMYGHLKFETYVNQINKFPDQYFDIVVVDGRARPSCIAHSVNKIKKGGFLIVDNSEREHYKPSLRIFSQSWKKWDFMGPVPYSFDFSQTSILKKP